MKILQISAYFHPSYRGTEKTVARLSESLTQVGHDVDILTVNTEGVSKNELWKGGIRVYRCSPNLRYQRAVLSMELLRRLLEAKGHDLYHIHIPFHSGLEMTIFASKINRTPIVATHHGEGVDKGLLHGIYNVIYQYTQLNLVKRIIFFTRSYPDSLRLSQELRRKVRVIRPAVDTTMYNPSKNEEELRKKYRVTRNQPLILSVSTLNPWDHISGITYLINAMGTVVRGAPEARLLVVGEGGLLPELKKMTQELGLGSNIIFAGKVIGEDLALHYAMCDIFVQPSLIESFGYATLEAMASGKPAVVSDIPGIGELIRDGVTGRKVPPKDAEKLAEIILFLLRNKEERRRMGLNARREVENRSWLQVAEEVEEVYEEVV